MKFGLRTPSLKKRISARTSWKRVVRHSLGIKAPRGWGLVTNPKKALYNKVYNKSSVSIDKLLKIPKSSTTSKTTGEFMNNTHKIGIDSLNTGTIIRSSSKALTVTSKNFTELRQQITDIYYQRMEINKKLQSAKLKLTLTTFANFTSYILLIGFFTKELVG